MGFFFANLGRNFGFGIFAELQSGDEPGGRIMIYFKPGIPFEHTGA
jgi:hypothetical protein